MAKFSEVLTIINGKNQSKVENPNGRYPIYGSGGIMGYADDYLCDAETVVIGRKGSINKPIFVEEPFWNVDTAFGLVADRKLLHPKFLFYFCVHFDFEQLNTTVTIPSLTKANLLNIEMPLPNLDVQQVIVDRLSKIDSLIALRKEQLAKLDQLVKARFVELMDSVELSEETTIEQITERVKVGFVGTCEKYYTDNSGIPMLRTGNITDRGIDMSDLKYVTAEFHEKNKKSQIRSGDLLIARHGSNGQANVYDGPEAQCLNAVVIVPNSAIAKSVFLAGLINSPKVKEQIDRTLVGSTQHVVNTKSIANLVVRIPELTVQEQYEAFVKQIDKTKLTIQASLDKLEVMKKALMQEYFG